MAKTHLKFTWGTPRITNGEWRLRLFARYRRSGAFQADSLAVNMAGVLVLLGALAAAGYLAAVTVLYTWLDKRPFNYVTWADCALYPLRKDEIRQKRGRSYIDEGLEDMRARRWREGEMKLRIGIDRHPGDLRGRLELARFLVAINARRQASDYLRGGLDRGYPGRTYLQSVLQLAAQGEDFALWIDACDRGLATLPPGAEGERDRQWLTQQKLQALLAADRGEEALALAEQAGAEASSMVSEFKVMALLKAGSPPDALTFLDAWRQRTGANPQIVRLRVRALREAGRLEEMEQALEELRQFTPSDPRPYIYGVVQRAMAGREAAARDGLDRFLIRFGAEERNVVLLAEPLAEVGRPDLVQACLDHSLRQGMNALVFRRLLVQANLKAHRWQAAQTVFDEIKSMPEGDEPGAAFWNALISRVVSAAINPADGAQLALTGFVRERQLPLRIYRDLIEEMTAAGRLKTARDLVTFAFGVFPASESLKTAQAELDVKLAAIAAGQTAEVAARNAAAARVEAASVAAAKSAAAAAVSSGPEAGATPPGGAEPKAGSAGAALPGEKEFFAKISEWVSSGDAGSAVELIRRVRAARPAWLAPRETELLVEEIRIAGRGDEPVAFQSLVRRYLNGDRVRSLKAIELAKEIDGAGKNDHAQMLVQEILRKVPDFPPARRLLQQWAPPAASAAPAAPAAPVVPVVPAVPGGN